MSFAQILLTLSLIGLALYVFRLRSLLLERAIYMAAALVGLIVIVRPEWSSTAANAIGVGRGADLIFYLFIVFVLFHSVSVMARLRRVDRQLTELARDIALLTARRNTQTTPATRSQPQPES